MKASTMGASAVPGTPVALTTMPATRPATRPALLLAVLLAVLPLAGCGGDDTCTADSCAATMTEQPNLGTEPGPAAGMGPSNGDGAGMDVPSPGVGAPAAGAGPGPGNAPAPGAEGPGPAAPMNPGAPGEAPDEPAPMVDAGTGSVDPPPDTELTTAVWRPDPAWDCGMPDGLPVPSDGEPLFTVELDVEVIEVGQTQYGQRTILNATGGTVSGDAATGRVLSGAYDYQLVLDNGVVEIEQIGVLQLGGGNVFFRSCGVAPNVDTPARVVADFEAGNRGGHAGLNEGRYLAERTYDGAQKRLIWTFYTLDDGAPAAGAVVVDIPPPAAALRQQWECPEYTGQPGEVVYRESVDIGGSVSVGASKYGSRNIIPITGGTSRDRLPGEVLAGGADYQLSGDTFFLDARYVIRSEDGELVAVRNCGPASTLVPTFETRTDGPYAFLNENRWLSSSPSISIGAVNLTIYERR